jgi:hypothetical protein
MFGGISRMAATAPPVPTGGSLDGEHGPVGQTATKPQNDYPHQSAPAYARTWRAAEASTRYDARMRVWVSRIRQPKHAVASARSAVQRGAR